MADQAGHAVRNPQSSGVSLIAAIFIIVILAFIGVIFVSLISTSTFTSLNDMQATQAFFIAEGGAEFDQRSLALNLDWYRSTTDPLPNPPYTRNLGAGTFTVSSNLPATKLLRRLRAGDATVQAYTTNRFPNAGFIQVEDDISGGAEFVQYAGTGGNNFTVVARGVMIGGIGNAAANHARGSTVYPVAALSAGLPANCASPASITIAENQKFLSAGLIEIEGEEISYSSSSTAGGIRTLTGIRRCLDAASQASPPAHAAGVPVTPILVGGETASYQTEVLSTGTVGGAVRVMTKTVQR